MLISRSHLSHRRQVVCYRKRFSLASSYLLASEPTRLVGWYSRGSLSPLRFSHELFCDAYRISQGGLQKWTFWKSFCPSYRDSLSTTAAALRFVFSTCLTHGLLQWGRPVRNRTTILLHATTAHCPSKDLSKTRLFDFGVKLLRLLLGRSSHGWSRANKWKSSIFLDD